MLTVLTGVIGSGEGRAHVRLFYYEYQKPENGNPPAVERRVVSEDVVLIEADAVGIAYEVERTPRQPQHEFRAWHSIDRIIVF